MKKSIVMMAWLLALLTGCDVLQPRKPGAEPSQPVVAVVDGKIAVPPVLAFAAKAGDPVTITWTLKPEAGLRFAENGIVIEGVLTDELVREPRTAVVLNPRQTEIVDCKPADEKRLSYSCINKRSVPGAYKYTVRLSDGKRELALDPVIANW